MFRNPRVCLLALFVASLLPALAQAQVTLRRDGQWRHLFGAGASISQGNSEVSNFNLTSDSIRATQQQKLLFNARAQYAKNAGRTTVNRFVSSGEHDRDFNDKWFGFGRIDVTRDRPAKLSSRVLVAGGVGYHLIRDERGFWDASVGLAYTEDRFAEVVRVEDGSRRSYGRAELLLSQLSNYKLTGNTTLRQRLTLLPNLAEDGRSYRGEFESALAVAMTRRLSLTAGLTYRYNSAPAAGLKRGDMLFVTGVSLRLD